MDQENIYNWKKIIIGYVLIALVGSLAIIVLGIAVSIFHHGAVSTVQPVAVSSFRPVAASSFRVNKEIRDVLNTIEAPAAAPPAQRIAEPVKPVKRYILPANRWAIVKNAETKTYNSTGKLLDKIKLGTIVYVCGTKTHPDGDLALCELELGNTNNRVYIRERNLNVQSGSISQIQEKEKTLRVNKVCIIASISKKVSQDLMKSQCYADYKRAKDSYKAFRVRVKQMTAKRNAARGAKHMKYSEELQKMKNEGAALTRDLDAKTKATTIWRNAHKANDPEIARLQEDLIQVEQQIMSIEQGL